MLFAANMTEKRRIEKDWDIIDGKEERGGQTKAGDAQRTINHATTSAALKLLRRLLIGLSPGLPDLGAATTTAAASLLIQLVGGTPMAVREAGVSCTDPVGRCPGRFAATGKREGVGVVS